MSLRYKGAVISATPPTTTGGESGVASGSWTLEQQFQAQGAGNWPIPFVAKYIEDVFSTYLYTGNGSTQTITNGIDLSTYGGLVWIKSRSNALSHMLMDTVRGQNKYLSSDLTDAQGTSGSGQGLTSFDTTGFSLGPSWTNGTNSNGVTNASWTFRKQPKFFDVVTYRGNGSTQDIAHNLGSTPGCIIVKCIDTDNGNWRVYHRSLTSAAYTLNLNTTAAQASNNNIWNSTAPTSTAFTVGSDFSVNDSGFYYVAYLFAHNAGGFGLTGTDNVISCGSFTTDSGGNFSVNLGYEPQWILLKSTNDGTEGWHLYDNMRGLVTQPNSGTARLVANTSAAENPTTNDLGPTSTGFNSIGNFRTSNTYVYIAIRRGPMKVPTSGTSVFAPTLQSASSTAQTKNYGITTDSVLALPRNQAEYQNSWWSRLQGANRWLSTASTAAENTSSTDALIGFDAQTGVRLGVDAGSWVQNTANWVHYPFQRAPSFFDEICYTGTGSALTVNHNLGVAPEIIIIKKRVAIGSSTSWYCGWNMNASTYMEAILNTSDAGTLYNYPNWFTSAPTSTTFALAGGGNVNSSGATAVAYLFATCAGVSKVGSYTGTGTTLQVDCGFTGGARFVLIKRTDSTGDWYVYDTARGMTTLTDPYLLLNSTAAESVTLGSVTTVSTGFAVNASILAAINTSGASYIFLAIA